MDDPIFDPWCLGDEEWPTPSQRGSRWRAAADSREGVPARRPTPAPFVPLLRPIEPSTPSEPSSPGEAPKRSDLAKPAAASAADACARRLGALLLPRLEGLTRTLAAARHRTTLDDRLRQTPPSVRFRLEPWRGAFDDADEGAAAVLEVLVGGGPAGGVSGRYWPSSLATAPSAEVRIAVDDLSADWIDRLLLDFVRRALRQA